MPRYVDGFLLVVPKKRLGEYRTLSRKAARVWKEHGALDYVECVGDDLNQKFGLPFPKLTKLKVGEVVVFSWIIYKSRAHRGAVNKKVMKDPRLQAMMAPGAMPFDDKRMSMGGFSVLVDA